MFLFLQAHQIVAAKRRDWGPIMPFLSQMWDISFVKKAKWLNPTSYNKHLKHLKVSLWRPHLVQTAEWEIFL